MNLMNWKIDFIRTNKIEDISWFLQNPTSVFTEQKNGIKILISMPDLKMSMTFIFLTMWTYVLQPADATGLKVSAHT